MRTERADSSQRTRGGGEERGRGGAGEGERGAREEGGEEGEGDVEEEGGKWAIRGTNPTHTVDGWEGERDWRRTETRSEGGRVSAWRKQRI